MEWQAAYISGALLMPRPYLQLWAGEIAMREAKQPPLSVDSDLARAAIELITRRVRSPSRPHGSGSCVWAC
jgi:hypothetical protein